MSAPKRLRVGDRVRMTGHAFMTGIPHGTLGTVACAPAGIGASRPYGTAHFVYVDWDGYGFRGVFRRELERAPA